MANPAQLTHVKQTLIEVFRLRMKPDEIGDDDPLFGEGLGLDSVDAIELVTALDRRYNAVIEGEEQSREHFKSVRTLTAFIVAEGGLADVG